ncbi:hypothetical protein K2C01_004575, partial [Vibrio vulnificus]
SESSTPVTINATVTGEAWTATAANLADGTYTWVIKATDAAGNTKELAGDSAFTLDSAVNPASKSLLSEDVDAEPQSSASVSSNENDEATLVETKVFQGEAKAESEITLTIDEKEYTTKADDEGDWAIKVEFTRAGEYSYNLAFTDDTGQSIEESKSVVINTIDVKADPSIGDSVELVEDSNLVYVGNNAIESAEVVEMAELSQITVDTFDFNTYTEKEGY